MSATKLLIRAIEEEARIGRYDVQIITIETERATTIVVTSRGDKRAITITEEPLKSPVTLTQANSHSPFLGG